MTGVQLTGLLATVGAAFLAQSVGCAVLGRQVRRLAARLDPGDPASSTDAVELAAQVRRLEARMARLESKQGNGRADSPGATDSKRLRRLDRRQVAAGDGPVLITVPSLALPLSGTSSAEAAAEFDRRFGAIWALADSGALADEISRQTGYPVGQVELILGLRGLRAGGDPGRDDADA